MSVEEEVKKIREDVETIKLRNKRVEADKAWETSKTRNTFIALTSFVIIYIVMRQVNADHPFTNAVVSAAIYLLSTASYGIIKQWWLKRRR